MTLVSFVAGAITAVLVVMGLWFEDEEHSFWAFRLTENKSHYFTSSIFEQYGQSLLARYFTDTSSTESANSAHRFIMIQKLVFAM